MIFTENRFLYSFRYFEVFYVGSKAMSVYFFYEFQKYFVDSSVCNSGVLFLVSR